MLSQPFRNALDVLIIVMCWICGIIIVIQFAELGTYSYRAMSEWAKAAPKEIILVPESPAVASAAEALKARLERTLTIPVSVHAPLVTEDGDSSAVKPVLPLMQSGEPLCAADTVVEVITAHPIQSKRSASIFSLQLFGTEKRIGVISLRRISNIEGFPPSTLQDRLFKLALRNIGVAVGFRSSRFANCVMRTIPNIKALDRLAARFCGQEERHLRKLGMLTAAL